jgi:hypothetical protein
MRLEVTDAPRECDEAFVIAQTRAYNATFAESRSLCVFAVSIRGARVASSALLPSVRNCLLAAQRADMNDA